MTQASAKVRQSDQTYVDEMMPDKWNTVINTAVLLEHGLESKLTVADVTASVQ